MFFPLTRSIGERGQQVYPVNSSSDTTIPEAVSSTRNLLALLSNLAAISAGGTLTCSRIVLLRLFSPWQMEICGIEWQQA
jgi:hypothetical protein